LLLIDNNRAKAIFPSLESVKSEENIPATQYHMTATVKL